MNHLAKRLWLLLPLLVLTLQTSWGQAPSGPQTFFFSTPNTAVYDLSGLHTLNQDIIGTGGTPVPLSIHDLYLTHDRAGRLRGTGNIITTVNGWPVAATYTATGRVSGGGNRPVRVQLSVRLSGKDVVGGVQTGFSISVRYDLTVDPNMRALVGTAKGRASFSRLAAGGPINSQNVVVSLPPEVDGTWTAQFDVQPLNRLTGSGALVLSNGRTLPVRLNGNFIRVSGRSNVRLNGFFDGESDGRGSMLRMELFNVDGASVPDVVSGAILGQKVMQ